ncbi:MAG: hypothetical protein JRI97_02805 [Deltaproteobacteria bacterium]|nr:hypothetical protein [Deltaproteobacteria bacterium]
MRKPVLIVSFSLFALVLSALPAQGRPYDFADALADIAPDGQGAAAAEKFFAYLYKINSNDESDEKAEEFFSAIKNAAKEFDFRKIYKSGFLSDWGDGFRGIRFAGISSPGEYKFTLVPRETDLEEISGGFGSFITDFALRKNEKSPVGGRSFYSYLETWSTTEDLCLQNILAWFENSLKVLDPANLSRLARPNGPAGDGPVSMDVLPVFKKNFPGFTKYTEPYFDWGSSVTVLEHEGIPYSRFDLYWSLKIGTVAAHYPNLARYLKGLKDFVKLRTVLTDSEGNLLVEYTMDTRERFFTFRCWTRKGKVLPMSPEGEPVFARELSLTNLSDLLFVSKTSMKNAVLGLKFETTNIRFAGRYRRTDEETLFILKTEEIPKTKVWGLAYYIVPKWVLDIFIPGDLDGLIHDFSKVMEQAGEGEGTRFVLEWDNTNPEDRRLHYRIVTEVADNFFLRFGFDVLKERFRMDKKTGAEMNAMLNLTLQALLEDLAAMQRTEEEPMGAGMGPWLGAAR